MFPERGERRPTGAPVQRRAFQPPKSRPLRRQGIRSWPPADWRERVPLAFTRAIIAAGFLAAPAFDERFGGLSFALTCATLAIFSGLGAYALAHSEAHSAWPAMATDAVVCGLLVPVIAVAGRVQVAAPELGGSTRGFVAAAVALSGAFTIVVIVAVATSVREDRRGGIELLTGSLIVGVAMVGAERFAIQDFTAGLSFAAMSAALVTILDGFAPRGWRALLPVSAFVLVVLATAAIAREGDAGTVSDSKAMVALLVSAVAGGALLIIPVVTARLDAQPKSIDMSFRQRDG